MWRKIASAIFFDFMGGDFWGWEEGRNEWKFENGKWKMQNAEMNCELHP